MEWFQSLAPDSELYVKFVMGDVSILQKLVIDKGMCWQVLDLESLIGE
jgi:hypothetical protein